ncbi:protein hairless [Armigeres subalbatus]|uniref:protein hairless n=1 Tax=Armigeres subalbatus TaxID=124917 RepID=UPI002ED2C0DE
MYVINPANSGKDIPNSYPTNAGSNSNSSSGSGSSTVVGTQEIISKILTKCATMTDAESSSTVNGTATILLSPSAAVRRNQPSAATTGGLVGVSPQSSPASSSSSASSPTADGPYPHSGFQTAAGKDKAKPGGTGSSGSAGGTNGSAGKHGDSSAAGNGTVTGKINGNGTHSGSISAPGGRLQFFKDGKFILELARAREGEKTSWISVPRKTFWPPTISSTNANFHKHESSTSLSFSDDNSSVQSSPWQRDHCWKQTNPRSNISKEMSLYYHRPSCVRFRLSRDEWKRLRQKRRRPYEPALTNAANVALPYEIIRDRIAADASSADVDVMDFKVNGKSPEAGSDEDEGKVKLEPNESAMPAKENGTKDFKISRRRGMIKRRKDLGTIVQQLTVRVANSANSGAPRLPPAGMRTVFSSSHQQHVSPRKRILRELEKVSLEDSSTMKRSRSKPGSNSTVITATTATPLASVSSNGNGTSNSTGSSSSNSNSKLSNGVVAPSSVPTTPVSRPISSYSITSLLGHNSTSESNSIRIKQETNTTTSQHPYQQHQASSHYQYLGKDVTSPKSPSDPHLSQRYYGKKKSPSYGSQNAASPNPTTDYGAGYSMVRSPNLSPSPEHQGHSFTRYRQHPYSIHPTVSSPSSYSSVSRCSPSPSTNDSASSPYSGSAKYRSTYLASGGSPPSSSNPGTANSPQHYSRQSPLNFARSPPPSHQASYPSNSSFRNNGKDPTLSPRASPNVEPIRVPATTPTSSCSNPTIRTVPKKTAALRQQFGSPSSSPSTTDAARRERSNSNASSTSSEIVRTAHFKKELDYVERSSASDVVDGVPPALSTSQSNTVIRPSTVIASPTPHHPVPPHHAVPNPFYMYPPQIAASLLAAQQSSAVPFLPIPPYYQHMYSQAAMAAAYRSPLWMHYQSMSPHAISPPSALQPSTSSSSSSNSSTNRDAQQRDSTRPHSAATVASSYSHNTTASNSSSSTTAHNNKGSSSSPSPGAAALNYSAAALAASSHPHHPHHPAAQHHSMASGPWSVPQHEVPVPSATSGAIAIKQEHGADVPLNLSKH